MKLAASFRGTHAPLGLPQYSAGSMHVQGAEEPGAPGLSFGELVRVYRAHREMTQSQVAAAAGCSTAYIGLLEQGRRGARPTTNMTRSLAQALNLNPAQMDRFFRAAGHLDEGHSLFDEREPGVITAINADTALSRANRQLMIRVYCTLSRRRSRAGPRRSPGSSSRG